MKSYNDKYNINLKEQTEYINNQLVNIAEIHWINKLDSFNCMFSRCVNIISINLNNFDTSICTDMTGMFAGCSSLVSIDLNNFLISSAINIGQMFRGCSSLTSLDLSSFSGTNVQYMDNMFNGCSLLVHINLDHFYYRSVIRMGELFNGCISLVSLNLPNFYTQNAQYMDKLFYNCKNLQYINIENVINSYSVDISNMFFGMPQNFVICYSNSNAEKIDNEIKYNPCRVKDCSGNWKEALKKYNVNSSTCINDCKINNLYEYETKCYQSCPLGTLRHTSMFCKKCNETTNNCYGCSMLDTDDDLCISCKNGFYEIYNNSNINNYFKKCYHFSEEYYLDEIEENRLLYKPCYNSCLICDIKGNETRHNIIQCKTDYIYEIEYTNYRNCYQSCYYYHYRNIHTRKSYCTETLKCPEEYNKLITEKRECVSNCNSDSSKKNYEFNNKCYEECHPGKIQPLNEPSLICVPKYIYSFNNKSQLINDIQEYLLNVFDGAEIDEGQDLEIQGEGIFIEITTPQNQKLIVIKRQLI